MRKNPPRNTFVDLLQVEEASRLLLEVGEHICQDLGACLHGPADGGIFTDRLQEVLVGVGSVSPREELVKLRFWEDRLNIFHILRVGAPPRYDSLHQVIVQGAGGAVS